MLLDGLRSLFLEALRFDGNDATVLVTRWNEEIDYIQSVFDTMTNKKPEPLICTNADRIRAMTDEELSEWIHTHIDCEPTCPCFDACHKEYEGEAEKYFIYTPCEQKLLEWLKQEVKDGD